MSIKIVCDECGRATYSAAAQTLLDAGYRCACGATPRIEAPGAAERAGGGAPPDDDAGDGLPGP
jgi:hypothetical protein